MEVYLKGFRLVSPNQVNFLHYRRLLLIMYSALAAGTGPVLMYLKTLSCYLRGGRRTQTQILILKKSCKYVPKSSLLYVYLS